MKCRTFMKVSVMAAATSAATRLAYGQDVLAADVAERQTGTVKWNKAPCRFCGTGCTLQVGVDKGRVVAVAGDQLAEVNKGLACVKGYHAGSILYGKDRLTTPLLKKGDGFVPISWPEAVDIVAKRVLKAPKGFAVYGSGQWTIPEGYAMMKFVKGALASNQIDPNARLCMSSAVTGFTSTYGVDEPVGTYT